MLRTLTVFFVMSCCHLNLLHSQVTDNSDLVSVACENGFFEVYENGETFFVHLDSAKTQLITAPHGQEFLEIVDSQLSKIDQIRHDSASQLASRIFGKGGRLKIPKTEVNKHQEEISQSLEDKILRELLPSQVELLDSYPDFVFVSRNGLLSYVLSGGGGKISISNEQKQKLRKKSELIREKLLAEMRRLEDSVVDELIKELPKEKKAAISQLREKMMDSKYVPILNRLYTNLGRDCCSDGKPANGEGKTITLPNLSPTPIDK